jgi:outer membrane receptor protein involved in Fe transport
MRYLRQILPLLFAAAILVPSTQLEAQVTTATLYGVVRDSTGAVLPGANVTATHQGTNLLRDTLTDERGEFALPALPTGSYALKIELPGFKTYTNQGLNLGAGQSVRQTFVLDVGQLTENITVAATVPLVETASAAQQESLGVAQVTQLPLARRNLVNVIGQAPGVTMRAPGMAGNGVVRLNGVGEGGALVTVDGTDAAGNPESRGLDHYGGQAQISVMSIEAVGEVQIVKGILPAEYGGTAAGQINILSRSGGNELHGSLLENYQGEEFFARNPFLSSRPKPSVRFNQFGGSLGGPIVRQRAFFFAAYEGYRETAGIELQGTVPTQQLRNQVLAASPFKETEIVLNAIPLPNEPINQNVGRWRGARDRTRRDNHVLAKGDVRVYGGNLSVTYTRMRPYTDDPSIYIGTGNNQKYINESDRVATQYVLARGSLVSESRFGWNRNQLDRAQDFWFVQDPNRPAETDMMNPARRMPQFTISGLFNTPGTEVMHMEGRSFSAEQKLSRVVGAHNMKLGFRWIRQGGQRPDPQNPNFTYDTFADFQANTPSSVAIQPHAPPHAAHLDEYGAFFQDDWRVNRKLVLNLGLRYDYYPVFGVKPTTNLPAELYNLNPPTDLRKMDFGAPRDPKKPYDPDKVNFGPRIGYAWTLDEKGNTVVRGGVGFLFMQFPYAAIQTWVSNPFTPTRVTWNRTEAAARGLKWPMYTDQMSAIAIRDAGGQKIPYGLFDTHLPAPYTIQSMINVQHSFGPTWMAEVAYVRTNGRNFPMHRNLAQAFDRQTGARPNPALGSTAGYYVSSEQTMVYNALQASGRKHLSNNLSFEGHYTLSKGFAQQGGNLSGRTINPGLAVTQDIWNPELDRSPLSDESRHVMSANAIYELPWLRNGSGVLSHILGGWQISSIFRAQSGVPLRITQPSGIENSRPDYVGGNTVMPDWGDTLQYLNRAAFARVPTYAATGATIRPGTANPADARGPGAWTVDMSLQKTFSITESVRVQFRADAFNALNHVNYNNPNSNITSPDFGRITGTASARTGQVGVRLTF